MAGISYLTAADVVAVAQARLDGLATIVALSGVSLIFERHDATTGRYEDRPAQTVAVRWADRLPDEPRADGASGTLAAGEFRKEAPFDVVLDDRFVLDGKYGRIVPPIRTEGGIVRAAFLVDMGAV